MSRLLPIALLLVGCQDPQLRASFRTDCEPVEIAEGHLIRMECSQQPSIKCKLWVEPPQWECPNGTCD